MGPALAVAVSVSHLQVKNGYAFRKLLGIIVVKPLSGGIDRRRHRLVLPYRRAEQYDRFQENSVTIVSGFVGVWLGLYALEPLLRRKSP